MYRFYVILLFLIIVTNNVFAQKTIDRETYESAVDHLNCELAKFYMLEDPENGSQYVYQAYLDSLAVFPCSFEHLMVFIKERQPQLEANGDLAVYIEEFKEEFEELPTNSALYNRLMDIFKSDLLIEFKGQDKFEVLKLELKNYLEDALRKHELIDNNIIIKTENQSSTLWDWVKSNIWLLVFGIIFFFFSFTVIRWAMKYFNTGRNNKLTKKSLATDTQNQSKIPAKTQTINQIHQSKAAKITPKAPISKSIVLEKKELEKQVEAIIQEVPQMEDTEEEAPEEAAFYMPYPSIDGSFYELQNSETEVIGQSTFKFKLVNEKYALATFEILSNDKIITDIFMDYERTIKSACDIEGNPKELQKVIRPGIVKIVTIAPGTAQKTGQHWRLKKKAVIRFEYE